MRLHAPYAFGLIQNAFYPPSVLWYSLVATPNIAILAHSSSHYGPPGTPLDALQYD